MEIVYINIKKFRNLENVEFSVSNECDIEYKNNKLNIKDKENREFFRNFYGDNIQNLTLILGKNGSGKSSLLEFIVPSDEYKSGFIVFKDIEGNFKYISYDKEDIYCENYQLEKTNYISVRNFVYYDDTFNNGIINNKKKSVTDISTCGLLNEMNLDNSMHFSNEIKNILLFRENNNDFLDEVEFNVEKVNIYLVRKQKKKLLSKEDFLKSFIDIIFENSSFKDFILKQSSSEEKYELIEKLNELINNDIPLWNNEGLEAIRNSSTLNDEFKYKYNIGTEKMVEDISKAYKYEKKEIMNSLRSQISFNELNKQSKVERDIRIPFKKLTNMMKAGYNFINSYGTLKKENNGYLEINLLNNEENFGLIDFLEFSKANSIGIHFFDYRFRNLSSGEYHYLSLFSRIYAVKAKIKRYTIFLMDEPDVYLHPEWNRQFISNLKTFIDEVLKIKCQVFICSHSPYLASDVPNDNLIRLQKDIEKNDIDYSSKSFAANIYDLFKDSFFMADFMGEFAKNKITKEVIEKLEESNINSKDLKKMEDTVNLIGDEILSTFLMNRVNEKKEKTTSVEDIIKKLSNEDREKALKLLSKRSDE